MRLREEPALTTAYALPRRTFLTDRWTSSAVGTVVLVAGFAALTALSAQVSFKPHGWVVPITGQTFAVVLSGAALGTVRGAASMLLYALAGICGLHVFSHGAHGWSEITGATGGYIIGFIVSATVVGWAAERGWDRTPLKAWPLFVLGLAIVYAIGVPWLKYNLGLPWHTAIHSGMTVFVWGEIIKVGLAGLLLPAAWRVRKSLEH
jgi:biotin transport system substrate-specific component